MQAASQFALLIQTALHLFFKFAAHGNLVVKEPGGEFMTNGNYNEPIGNRQGDHGRDKGFAS